MSDKFKIVKVPGPNSSQDLSILIVYTGGTFGMAYDEDGHLAPFNFGLVAEKVPELEKLDLNLTVISFPDPVDSSNIKIKDWQNIGHIIYANYSNYDGFVVLHGTDTMAYTASALSFMLEGLSKPIIFTGAQIPIGALRSDARENLITAIEIAATQKKGKPKVGEVCLYFNHLLLRGNRAQKVRSSHFGAFESENYPALAEAGVKIAFNTPALNSIKAKSKLNFISDMEEHVSVLKLFPQIGEEVVDAILGTEGLKGLVMESFGSGNTMNEDWFLNKLKKSIEDGLLILNVSQCAGGQVIHGRYATSKKLSEMGVISGSDITTEAGLTKMMHLLANEKSYKTIKDKLTIPLRGELTA